MTDHDFMRRALALAERGAGWVAPNPMVGAVIVKDGHIIGEGWHARYGDLHAERAALANASADVRGATLYVTLEPCCHHGKQPPCTDAIIASDIARVVVGSADPNPLVAGKGIAQLRAAGIEVIEDVLRADCDALNAIFLHYIRTGRPYVILKTAMTLDGKIATHTGASKWVTGEAARQHVQEQRHRLSAIMVGVGTVLADDPRLTCRLPESKSPTRIICDTHLRTPLTATVVTTARQTPTIIATCCRDAAKQRPYRDAGCRLIVTGERDSHLDLDALMQQLGQAGIDSILLEGGGTLNWAALEAGIVQRVQTYLAPKLFGGATAKTPVEGTGVALPDDAAQLRITRVLPLGDDLLIESEVIHHVYRHH